MEKYYLDNNTLHVELDQTTGNIISMKMVEDQLHTEFIGNKENISYPAIFERNQWTGDIKLRVWDSEKKIWTEEITAESEDVRKISKINNGMIIEYGSPSVNNKGIRSVVLKEKFCMEEDALYWQLSINNPSESKLEVGELSLAFLMNTDYTGIFEDEEFRNFEDWRGIKQKLWHEKRVQQHLSIDGSSSYVFCQRPKGDYPALIFQILDGDKIEEAYQMDKQIGCQWSLTFEGPYYLSLYSAAARKCEGWKFETEQQKYGMNGNHSLVLEAHEEKTFRFRFCSVNSEFEMKEQLYQAGQLDIDVQPSMVVPVGVPLRLRIRSKEYPKVIPVANNMRISENKKHGDCYYYDLEFSEPGQKKIKIFHGRGETVIAFYAIDNIRDLLKKHAQFIVQRQFYDNPQDPFGRHNAFLPYDDSVEMIFTESEESWQVGGLDEYALPVAMYVAEKNAIIPDLKEIEVLERYIDNCLYGKLQEKETYYAKRGLYYEERTPSDIAIGNKWDKEKADSILRSFNYPLISDIYFSMYKIAAKYNLTRIRDKNVYLEMAYRTAITGYELGRNKFNGAPAGATVIELLKVLNEEKREWYEKLNRKLSFIAEENAESIYPFGSELYVDQTSHNQYQAMMKYYGKKDKLEEAYRVTYALRNGWQPEWFLYGNEKRGNVCCWYGTPLNSRVLFEGFEETGDTNMLKLGYGGLLAFLTCIRSNGVAHGWYLSWPDRSGFDLRSLDTDMGMYGYLCSAKSYLIDDEIFGRCGYGCLYMKQDGEEIIVPYDGLGLRFRSVPHVMDLECVDGCMKEIRINNADKQVVVKIEERNNYGIPCLKAKIENGWKIKLLERQDEYEM